MAEWYIVYGANGQICVGPNILVEGREIIKKIKCKGIKDALEQLHKFEEGMNNDR